MKSSTLLIIEQLVKKFTELYISFFHIPCHSSSKMPKFSRALVRCFWSGIDSRNTAKNKSWVKNYLDRPARERQSILEKELSSNLTTLPNRMMSFMNCLSSSRNGVSFAIALREDLLQLRKDNHPLLQSAQLLELETNLKNWMLAFFAEDALLLETVSFSDSSGSILEFIANNEGVHSVKSVSELKNRLSNGKRCFSLFHSKYSPSSLSAASLSIQ